MKNNKGFTVVELVASFALAMVVFTFLFEVIVILKDIYIYSGVKTELLHKQAMISNKINESLTSKEIKIAMTCGENCLFFIYEDNTTSRLVVDETNKTFTWGDYTTKLANNSDFGTINISSETVAGVASGKKDSIITIKIPIISANIENQDFGINIAYQYDSRTSSITGIDFNEETGSEKSIFLNGTVDDVKTQGANYTDPGYFVYYANGTVVFNDPSVTVTSTPVDVLGQTYNITYTITESGQTVATATRYITVVGTYNYAYTGAVQTFTAPVDGVYQVELWGAQGGATSGGKGGYTKGSIYLNTGDQLYVYVGAQGNGLTGGYNGGANVLKAGVTLSGTRAGTAGGGATDVRLISGAWNNFDSLKSRIIVAGGGSGNGYETNAGYGSGGNLLGGTGQGSASVYQTQGGTQTSPGSYHFDEILETKGEFGIGGSTYSSNYTTVLTTGGSGGGGYYGGGGNISVDNDYQSMGEGGGGSSFISGYPGVNAVTSDATLTHSNNTKHYSNYYFLKGTMQSNVNTGNGKAAITYIASHIYKTTSNLNAVRYIKDCINGNTSNNDNHWLELQAINNGNNVAYGKTVTGTVSDSASFPYTRITDGNITTTTYAQAGTTGLQCITVDLGNIYNLDEISVWHYYGDTRSYNENTTYVSNDNVNWTTVINASATETQLGKRISAY